MSSVSPWSAAPQPDRKPRLGYLDWLRGLAVLIMIASHILDSWTRLDDRGTPLYTTAMIVGGLGGPLFLFLAGVSVSLSADSKFRRTADRPAASQAVVRRGLEIFGLAFLFRLQACILSWGAWWTLLKVDILNVMGPSIIAAAFLWGRVRSTLAKCLAFTVATVAIALLTPPIRATELLSPLPDAIEAYLRPKPGLTNFVLFPWAGFAFAGAIAGALLADARAASVERRVVVRLTLAGAAAAAASYAASFFPSPYERSDFWTSSPSYFFLRTGILTTLIGIAFAWEQRPWVAGRFSPLQQLGRTSLFIYWIHVEMIYGLAVRPLHKSMGLPVALSAIPLFAAFMLVLSIAKERVLPRFRQKLMF